MTTVIVLAMHRAPLNDFSERETAELFGLHVRLAYAHGPERAALEHRHAELDAKMRAWPRDTACRAVPAARQTFWENHLCGREARRLS